VELLGRILLVEDDPNDVELTLTALEQHNLRNEIVVAYDGEEALDYLYRRGRFVGVPPAQPAVVLLDLKLPKISGFEVLRQIKSDPLLKMIPVVILTSSGEDKDLAKCYELGTSAYVVKPVNFHEFVDAVRDIGAFWAVLNEPSPGCVKRR